MVQRWIPESLNSKRFCRNFYKERLKESTGQFLKVDLPESLDVVASQCGVG